jgi:hypothetical protein
MHGLLHLQGRRVEGPLTIARGGPARPLARSYAGGQLPLFSRHPLTHVWPSSYPPARHPQVRCDKQQPCAR